MSSRKKLQLTKAELRAMDATPGLMARRYDADGCARLEQLVPEGSKRRKDFARHLIQDSKASEEGTSEGSE